MIEISIGLVDGDIEEFDEDIGEVASTCFRKLQDIEEDRFDQLVIAVDSIDEAKELLSMLKTQDATFNI